MCCPGERAITGVPRSCGDEPIGLDYPGCAAAAAGMGMAWQETFGKLQIMEAAMLAEWSE